MILELVRHDHPLLSQKLEPFDFKNPPTDPVELAKNLFETMLEHKGLGLAANQCGLPYRAFAIAANPGIVVFNPRIVDQTSEEILLEEGCLSYPNLFVKIKRPRNIKVRYVEPNGNVVTQTFIGMTARVFQHELDHLNGLNYKQRAHKIHLDRAHRQQVILNRRSKKGT